MCKYRKYFPPGTSADYEKLKFYSASSLLGMLRTVWMEHPRNKTHCWRLIPIILRELNCQLKRTVWRLIRIILWELKCQLKRTKLTKHPVQSFHSLSFLPSLLVSCSTIFQAFCVTQKIKSMPVESRLVLFLYEFFSHPSGKPPIQSKKPRQRSNLYEKIKSILIEPAVLDSFLESKTQSLGKRRVRRHVAPAGPESGRLSRERDKPGEREFREERKIASS